MIVLYKPSLNTATGSLNLSIEQIQKASRQGSDRSQLIGEGLIIDPKTFASDRLTLASVMGDADFKRKMTEIIEYNTLVGPGLSQSDSNGLGIKTPKANVLAKSSKASP